MRKPVVDYREFRLSRLTEPRFNHLLYLLGWVVYFLLYLLTENLIPVEACYPVHSKLDDIIPFCEWFAIPYVGWYLLIVVSLLYFALYNPKGFKQLQTYIIVTQLVAMAIYIAFPTRQDLRPTEFPRDNLLTDLMAIIYNADTNTGVCPSLHVGYSLGLASAWLREKETSPWWRAFVVVAVVFICISVAFVKQHSVVDIYAAIPLGLLAEIIAYGSWWKEKLRKKASVQE